ncbi:hypothetical protein ANO14919_064050 [Xylariales sp. No.14919]|nr:hypothetical protein ANO14919_064050 [Xylariales sp. No.14919]
MAIICEALASYYGPRVATREESSASFVCKKGWLGVIGSHGLKLRRTQ